MAAVGASRLRPMADNKLMALAQNHHDWILGAFQELIHNSSDAGAENLKIAWWKDKSETSHGGEYVVELTDDGRGMSRDEVDSRLLSDGTMNADDDAQSSAHRIGCYGEGFLAGSMRIGHTVVIITKKKKSPTLTVAIMSNEPYLRKISRKEPIRKVAEFHAHNCEAKDYAEWKAVASECRNFSFLVDTQLFNVVQDRGFNDVEKSGTAIFIQGLKGVPQQSSRLEFDLVLHETKDKGYTLRRKEPEDDPDICVASGKEGGEPKPFRREGSKKLPTAVPTDCSLRSLVAVMFYQPTLKISIGGTEVDMKRISSRLEDWKKYEVRKGSRKGTPKKPPIVATLGRSTKKGENQLGGAMVYVGNILVLSYCTFDFSPTRFHTIFCEVQLPLGRDPPTGDGTGDFIPDKAKLVLNPSDEWDGEQKVKSTIVLIFGKYETWRRNPGPKISLANHEAIDKWVQCDDCNKWRLLASEEARQDVDARNRSDRESKWFCWMNSPEFIAGDPSDRHKACHKEEEEDVGEEVNFESGEDGEDDDDAKEKETPNFVDEFKRRHTSTIVWRVLTHSDKAHYDEKTGRMTHLGRNFDKHQGLKLENLHEHVFHGNDKNNKMGSTSRWFSTTKKFEYALYYYQNEYKKRGDGNRRAVVVEIDLADIKPDLVLSPEPGPNQNSILKEEITCADLTNVRRGKIAFGLPDDLKANTVLNNAQQAMEISVLCVGKGIPVSAIKNAYVFNVPPQNESGLRKTDMFQQAYKQREKLATLDGKATGSFASGSNHWTLHFNRSFSHSQSVQDLKDEARVEKLHKPCTEAPGKHEREFREHGRTGLETALAKMKLQRDGDEGSRSNNGAAGAHDRPAAVTSCGTSPSQMVFAKDSRARQSAEDRGGSVKKRRTNPLEAQRTDQAASVLTLADGLKIASINVHGFFKRHIDADNEGQQKKKTPMGKGDLQDFANQIRKEGPFHVLAVQEAKVTAVGTSTQLSIFADKLDMDIAIQGKASHGLENVILVQKTEKEPEKFGPWNLGEEQQRNKKRNELRTAVAIRTHDKCMFVCTHLDNREESARNDQWNIVLHAIKEHSNLDSDELFILGDFNALRRTDYTEAQWNKLKEDRENKKIDVSTELTKKIEDAGFKDCRSLLDEPAGPVETCDHGARVDYVWASAKSTENWRVHAYKHHEISQNLTDHKLIVCHLKRSGGEGGDRCDRMEFNPDHDQRQTVGDCNPTTAVSEGINQDQGQEQTGRGGGSAAGDTSHDYAMADSGQTQDTWSSVASIRHGGVGVGMEGADNASSESASEKSPKAKKAKVDGEEASEAKLKKPETAYALFCEAKRAEAKVADVSKKLGTKELGEMWRELPETDKEPYHIKAAALKAEYDKKKPPSEAKKKKMADKAGSPAKAPSAYSLFTMDVRAKIVEEFPEIQAKEVPKIMSSRWKELSAEGKKVYEDKAKAEKDALAGGQGGGDELDASGTKRKSTEDQGQAEDSKARSEEEKEKTDQEQEKGNFKEKHDIENEKRQEMRGIEQSTGGGDREAGGDGREASEKKQWKWTEHTDRLLVKYRTADEKADWKKVAQRINQDCGHDEMLVNNKQCADRYNKLRKRQGKDSAMEHPNMAGTTSPGMLHLGMSHGNGDVEGRGQQGHDVT